MMDAGERLRTVASGRLGALVLATLVLSFAMLFGRALASASAQGAQELPLAERPNVLGDDLSTWKGFMMSGGPPPDGIPSVDSPRFVSASAAGLAPGEPVIGFAWNGEARAYPQRIMVYHEIVNDHVGGLAVAITYCPLTATAQAFRRGGTTLGVSGQLLNSNLVMYDRSTGSRISQLAATAIDGPLRGRTLSELQATWTTWERWREAHPETQVLSERTGHLRNYRSDPYGSYDPLGGYYRDARTLFPLLHTSSAAHPKAMVVGARTEEASVWFLMDELRQARVLESSSFLALHDEMLDTGVIYRIPGQGAPEIEPARGGRFRVGGELLWPGDLPLERVVAVEAFHFAWHAFYPDSETARAGT